MRKFSIGIILIALHACKAKSNDQDIILSVKNTLTFDTCFTNGLYRSLVPVSKDTTIIISNKSYRGLLGKATIQDSTDIPNNEVLGFVTLANENPIVFVDTNNDGKLDGEIGYQVNDSVHIKLSNYKYVDGNDIKERSFYITPEKFGLRLNKQLSPLSSIGLKLTPPFKEALITLNKDSFRILISNPFFSRHFSQGAIFTVLKASDKPFLKNRFDLIQNEIGDTLYLGNYVFKLKNLDTLATILILEKIKLTNEASGFEIGKILPQQSVSDIKTGKSVSIGGKKEKLTVIDFWGTWCGPCTALTEDLVKMNNIKKDKINMISIAVDSDTSTVINYLKHRNVEWTNVFDNIESRQTARTFSVTSYPTFFLINKDGRVVYRGVGKPAFKQINQILDNIQD